MQSLTSKIDPAEQARQTRELAIEIARLCSDNRCSRVGILDVAEVSTMTDYFILANGTSSRQMGTVAQDVVDLAKSHGYTPMSTSGIGSDNWVAIDLLHIVIHLFSNDARLYYDLDNLWSEGKVVEWKREA